jgi:hypothetical protein
VLLPFLVSGNAYAQSEKPVAEAQAAAADKNSPEMSSRDTPATFNARVNLVLVPVVVRDGQGSTIGNLRRKDFQLFDKGKPQVISKFSAEKSGSQVVRQKESPDGKTAEKTREKSAPPAVPEHFTAYLSAMSI